MNLGELMAVLQSRRSIRRFTDRAVSREDLQKMLEAARWGPSNHNRQPWKFIVLEDRMVIRELAQSVQQGVARKVRSMPAIASSYAADFEHHATLFGAAPVLIVALHKRPVSLSVALLEGVANSTLVSGEPLSTAMAVQNLLLAAHVMGLGACVMTAPLVVPEAVAAHLDVPPGFECTCFVAVGHPGESPAAPRRKSLEQIAEFRENGGEHGKHEDGSRDL